MSPAKLFLMRFLILLLAIILPAGVITFWAGQPAKFDLPTLETWAPVKEVIAGVVITLVAAAWLRFVMGRGPLRVWHLTINGGLYASYLAIAMT